MDFIALDHKNVGTIPCQRFKPVCIRLHGEINKELTEQFLKDLHSAEATGQPFVTITIHSNGGDAYCCLRIVEAIETCSLEVITVVNAWAASCAVVIFSAGSRRFMGPHARLMIHDVWTTMGKATTTSDLREESREMVRLDKTLLKIMARHTENKSDHFIKLLQAHRNQDLYLYTDEALACKLATEVGTPYIGLRYHVDMTLKTTQKKRKRRRMSAFTKNKSKKTSTGEEEEEDSSDDDGEDEEES